jgi:hypothetical protein
MFHPLPARWLAALPALAALTVSAQTAATSPPAPTPNTPAAYRSALEGYQPFGDDKLRPWKESNDTVGKIGGWRAYAKEASEPQASGGPAPAASGAAHPHAGHGKP